MKWRFLLAATALALGGCATTTLGAQTQYVQACAAYGAAFASAVELRSSGKLNATQIASVTQIDSQITPICTGPLPADPTTATVQVTAALTTLGVIVAAQAATK